MFYNRYHTYFIMVFILHFQTIQTQFLLTTQFPYKSSNITPQKFSVHVLDIRDFSAYRTFMVLLVFKPTTVGASEEQQKIYEDDLHFTPVVYMKKTRILRQKTTTIYSC